MNDESRSPLADLYEKKYGKFIDEYGAFLVLTCEAWQMPDALTAEREAQPAQQDGGSSSGSGRTREEMEEFIMDNDIGYARLRMSNIFYPNGWRMLKHTIFSTKSYGELKQVYHKYPSIQDHWKFIQLIKAQRRIQNWK